MKILFILLLFYQGTVIALNDLVSDDDNPQCNFRDYDLFVPDAFPQISAPRAKGCGGKHLSLRKIFDNFDSSNINFFGAENIIDLMYCRIGECELDWNNAINVEDILNGVICEFHFEELLTKWETRFSGHVAYNKQRKLTCLFNHIFDTAGDKKCPKIVQRKIQKADVVFFSQDEIIIQPGAGFCKTHFAEIKEMIKGRSEVPNLNVAEAQNDGTEEKNENEDKTMDDGNQSDSLIDNDFDSGDMDPDFIPETSFDAELDKENANDLRKFAKPLGVDRIVTVNNFENLQNREKQYKVSGARILLNRIFEIMAPQCEEEFGAKVCQKYQIEPKEPANPKNNLMDAIVTQYLKTDDKRLRKIILGPMADACSYGEVKQKIPGLSRHLYKQAQRCFEFDELPEDLPMHFDRIDRPKIRVFMEFFTGPVCMIVLPYGEINIKLSNGEKVDVAANIRIQANAQIIRMFERKMIEEDRRDEILPRSTMYSILQHCHSKQSKALTCVDYFQVAALDGFDELKRALVKWAEGGIMDLQQSVAYQKQLKDGQQYLQNDFSISLKQNDEIISHCYEYGLSDPDDIDFSAPCQEHLRICSRCKSLHDVIDNLQAYIQNAVSICQENGCKELDDLEIYEAQIFNAVYHVLELKSHIFRARWSEKVRAEDIKNLKPGEAYITLDWGHKLLPVKFRESQKDFFGKEGMAHQVTHIQSVDNDGNPLEYAFLHIIEKNKQDSTAVAAILLDVLENLKKISITSVILGSDNAGCYHSKELILSIPEISKRSGVKVIKYEFCEPQNGKGHSDRIEALVKNKGRRHVNEGNNIQNEKEFFDAMEAFPCLTNTTFSVSTVNRGSFTIHSKSLVGIGKYYSFTFQENGILVHRAAKIGKGKLFKYSTKINTPITNIPTLTKSAEHNDIAAKHPKIWRTHIIKNRNAPTENDCPVHECPEAHCDATFSTFEELVVHIMEGKHQHNPPERLLQNDYVIKEYQQMVKQLAPKKVDRITAALQSELIEEITVGIAAGPKKGWAHQKPRMLPEITEEKREFVREKFNEGAKDKARKWKPKEISTSMFHAKKNGKLQFKPKEVLLPEQIQPMLSKFASEQKKTVANKRKAATTDTEPEGGQKKRRTKRNDDISESSTDTNDGDNCENISATLEDEKNIECTNNEDAEAQWKKYVNIASRALRYQRYEEIESMYDHVDENTVEYL